MPNAASDTTLTCPHCSQPIRLTESLAAPLVAATRAEFQAQLTRQAQSFAAEKEQLAGRQQALERRAAEVEAAARAQQQAIAQGIREGVETQLATERRRIAAEEKAHAHGRMEEEMSREREAARALAERNETLTRKLSLAQATEAGMLKLRTELEDKQRELELNVQQGIAQGLAETRAQAVRETQAALDLKVQERELTIAGLRDQITSLQRRAEQGSQQSQGEALEVALEHQLRRQFPHDRIEPVGKGEFGGDVLQHVCEPGGAVCGTILWESKRTKNWSDGWLSKLKGDQRAARADLAVLVSQTMPRDVAHFEQMEGIWVSSLSCILPVAGALRISVMELAAVRRAGEGQETKAQQIYAYLTGPRFRHRVECIAEKFDELRTDLDRERKWMHKQWAKREAELTCVLEATSGMYGDLQGIAGRNLKEIDALEGTLRLELKDTAE